MKFNFYTIFACFFFLAFAGKSEADTSFSFDGSCYGDTPSSLAAFQSRFPQLINGSIVNLVSSSIDSSGLITFVTQERLLSEVAWITNPSSTVQLPVCTSGLLATANLEHFFVIIFVVFLFIFGFKVGKAQFEHLQYGDRA